MDSPLYYSLAEAFTGRNKWKDRQNDYAASLQGKTTAALLDAQEKATATAYEKQQQRGIAALVGAGHSPEEASKIWNQSTAAKSMSGAGDFAKAKGYNPMAQAVGAGTAEADIARTTAEKEVADFRVDYTRGRQQGAGVAGAAATGLEAAKSKLGTIASNLQAADAADDFIVEQRRKQAEAEAAIANVNRLVFGNKLAETQLAEFMEPEAVKARQAQTTATRLTAEDVPNQLKANAAYRQSMADFNKSRAQALNDPNVQAAYNLLLKNPMNNMVDSDTLLQQAVALAEQMKQRNRTTASPAAQGDNPTPARPVGSRGSPYKITDVE